MRTEPVNQSSGPLEEGREPILVISITKFFYFISDVYDKKFIKPIEEKKYL